MEEEVWLPVREFPEHYEVSSIGRVRRKKAYHGVEAGRIRKMRMLGPYPAYWLSVDQQINMRYAHRLVADAFLGPIPAGMHVNHLDGDKTRPHVPNLEIVTNSENRKHAYRILKIPPNRGCAGLKNQNAKFGWETVCEIRNAYQAGEISVSELAKRYGVARQTIYRIGTGKGRLTA